MTHDVAIVLQACDLIKRLHRLSLGDEETGGFVHGSLCPRNFLLTERGDVKVMGLIGSRPVGRVVGREHVHQASRDVQARLTVVHSHGIRRAIGLPSVSSSVIEGGAIGWSDFESGAVSASHATAALNSRISTASPRHTHFQRLGRSTTGKLVE